MKTSCCWSWRGRDAPLRWSSATGTRADAFAYSYFLQEQDQSPMVTLMGDGSTDQKSRNQFSRIAQLYQVFKRHFMLFLYVAFLGFTSAHVYLLNRWANVENWPSVEAKILTMESFQVIRYQKFGSNMEDRYKVSYEYTVHGRTYQGNTLSPDGENFGLRHGKEPYRAYYRPGDPSISTLQAVPYKGIGLMLISAILGVLLLARAVADVLSFVLRKMRSLRPPEK
jgi:hypothetical protein